MKVIPRKVLLDFFVWRESSRHAAADERGQLLADWQQFEENRDANRAPRIATEEPKIGDVWTQRDTGKKIELLEFFYLEGYGDMVRVKFIDTGIRRFWVRDMVQLTCDPLSVGTE